MLCTVKRIRSRIPARRETPANTAAVTFAAAVAVLAASQSSMTDVSIDDDSFQILWSRCVSIFKAHEVQIKLAGRALEVLEAIKRGLVLQGAYIHFRSRGRGASNTADDLPVSAQKVVSGDVDLCGEHTEAMSSREAEQQEALDLPYVFDVDSIDDTWLNQWLAETDWIEGPHVRDIGPS